MNRLARLRPSRLGCVLVVTCALAACADDPLKRTSASPDTPWAPDGATATAGDFTIPANPDVGTVSRGVQSGKVMGLPELIDLAQRSHPSTRIAWEQARQSALAVGMVEATFLPIITANVIGGRQDVVTPLPNLQGGTSYVDTTASGVAPNIALQWLVFDFGQRAAWRDAAKQNAYAANVGFNGAHQALIYNVTRSYYQYGATQSNLAIAEQALPNSQRLLDAAQARYTNGTGTSIEVAQAKQLVAQSNLRLVEAQDQRRDAYQDLLSAVGISPRSQIKVASSADRRLPRARALPTDELIASALARRPDVLASYAAVKASEAGERAAAADFMPKVYVGGVAGTNSTGIQSGNLPGLSGQATSTGVVMGVSIPLYEGGLRDAKQRQARSMTAAAAATLEQTRDAAMSEIILASNTLRSSLEAYAAASELTRAAQVTYDAASDAYQNGIGTLTDATAAETGLLDARQARSDAHAASLIAASTLAFSLGAMTSRTSPAQAIAQ
jgi:outer membrane protein TolC